MTVALKANLNAEFPLTFAHTTKGELLVSNGVDRPQRWDGITAASEDAGISQATNSAVTSSGTGTINGSYYYGVRFLDDEDIPGDLSVLATFAATNRGLVSYSNVPLSTNSRVTKRQIFRSTAGQNITLYLDVEIDDNLSTTATSSYDDNALSANLSLPILRANGRLHARRFGVPPAHKEVVIHHQERTFWLVDAVVNQGHVELTSGAATCTFVGATVSAQFVGRQLHVADHSTVYDIDAASPSNNSVTLGADFSSASNTLAQFAVRMPKTERNLIYFSEVGEPESVPSTNAIRLRQEESDATDLTGGASFGSFLWLFTENALYRWTFQTHPVDDGGIFLTEHRGLLNQRCWVNVEGRLFVLDRQGPYAFNGGNASPIGESIQDYFRPGGGVRWERAKWFHVTGFPAEETIKFFVCLDGSRYPRHSLDYHYRRGVWWECEYPWPISASAMVPMPVNRRLLLGTSAERIMQYGEGTLDGPKLSPVSWYSVASATLLSVTVTGPSFIATDVRYAQMHVVDGRGKGQSRTILSANASTGRLELDRPWGELPDANSQVQIGGVPWRVRTKRLRLSDDGAEQTRGYRVDFTPTEATCTFDIRTYYGYRNVPANMAVSASGQQGLKSEANKPDLTVDMRTCTEGWQRAELGQQNDYRGPGAKFLSAELRGVQNQDQVEIHGLGIDGAK